MTARLPLVDSRQACKEGSDHGPDPMAPRPVSPRALLAEPLRDDRVMDRRTFLAGRSAVLVAAPLAAEAQKSQKIAHVGVLGVGPTPSPEELAKSMSTNPLWLSMRQLGWVYGETMIVERRFGESSGELRAGAADLVRLKVDVLFVGGAALAKLLQLETKTIPIVVSAPGVDLVGAGLIDSLARPGSNITGLQSFGYDLVPKRLELLETLVPNLSKVAVLQEDVTLSEVPSCALSTINRPRSRLGPSASNFIPSSCTDRGNSPPLSAG
jgi:hypothetical protein